MIIGIPPSHLKRFTKHSHHPTHAGLDAELSIQPAELCPKRVVTDAEFISNGLIFLLINDAADDLELAAWWLTNAQLPRHSHAAPNRA